MNAAEVHLVLNHLPSIIPLVGIPVLIAGLIKRSEPVQKAGLWILLMGGLSVIPTYLSGDPAEDVLKKFYNFSLDLVNEHEEAALFGLISMLIAAAISALILILFRLKKKVAKPLWAAMIFLSLWSLSVLLRTSYLGGLIRHEETRPAAVVQPPK